MTKLEKRIIEMANQSKIVEVKKFFVDPDVNEVIEGFDFDKVHKVMEFLNWQWNDFETNTLIVPSVQRLVIRAIQLLTQAKEELLSSDDKLPFYVSTGGFEAVAYISRLDTDIKVVCLKLTFNLDESEYDGGEVDEDYIK